MPQQPEPAAMDGMLRALFYHYWHCQHKVGRNLANRGRIRTAHIDFALLAHILGLHVRTYAAARPRNVSTISVSFHGGLGGGAGVATSAPADPRVTYLPCLCDRRVSQRFFSSRSPVTAAVRPRTGLEKVSGIRNRGA